MGTYMHLCRLPLFLCRCCCCWSHEAVPACCAACSYACMREAPRVARLCFFNLPTIATLTLNTAVTSVGFSCVMFRRVDESFLRAAEKERYEMDPGTRPKQSKLYWNVRAWSKESVAGGWRGAAWCPA